MLKPTLKQMEKSIDKNIAVQTMDGRLNNRNMKLTVIPKTAILFNVDDFKHGVVIDYYTLKGMKTTNEIERYIKAMLGCGIANL